MHTVCLFRWPFGTRKHGLKYNDSATQSVGLTPRPFLFFSSFLAIAQSVFDNPTRARAVPLITTTVVAELQRPCDALGGKQEWSWRFATTDGLVADSFARSADNYSQNKFQNFSEKIGSDNPQRVPVYRTGARAANAVQFH